MASNYKTPGVYVEEIPTLPASVAQVGTAIPAFIGYTEKAVNAEGADLTNVPTRIVSLPEYEAFFGKGQFEMFTVNIQEDNSPTGQTITPGLSPSPFKMYYAMQMYFANGGGPCYIVSVGDYQAAPGSAPLKAGLAVLEQEDEPTLLVFPDAAGINSASAYYGLMGDALDQCNKLGDRFLIADTQHSSTPEKDLRKELNSDYLKYGAAYYPYLNTLLEYRYKEGDVQISHQTADDPSKPGPMDGKTLSEIETGNSALYNTIKSAIAKVKVVIPPASSIAGIYARVDNERGVWKAPANVALRGVSSPAVKITDERQDGMNVDPTSGKSINAIRAFSGKGILVWGARTLAGNDNEWRYVSVRRFFNMVEESIRKATAWVVFEPNDANTWLRVKGMIENYLNGLWRQGALVGEKPKQAYFVNVGLGTTMTPQDILEGRMNVEIGLATSRPAEFIVLKFSHKLQEA